MRVAATTPPVAVLHGAWSNGRKAVEVREMLGSPGHIASPPEEGGGKDEPPSTSKRDLIGEDAPTRFQPRPAYSPIGFAPPRPTSR